MSVDDITPYDKNARVNDKAVDAVAKSIEEYGFKNPILIDKDGVIICGHTRLKGAKKLGYKEVPCVYADDLTPEQVKAFRIADNKTGEIADWDFDVLEEELQELIGDGYDISSIGFNQKELDEIIAKTVEDMDYYLDLRNGGDDADEDEEETEIEEDEVPEIDEENEPITKLGDIWQLGRHRLMCGDSTDKTTVEKLMNGAKADMVMTDPPYGINAEKMTMGTGKKDFHRGEDWDNERPDISIAFDIAPLVCIWGGNYFADNLPISNDWLIWHKKNDGLSFSECEMAWTNFGCNVRHLSHHWGNEKKLHVTMKPLEVIAWAINRAKEKANIIVDIFGGSGSTLIACEQLDRICYMMELDPKYCDVIIKRWETLTGQKAVLLNE